jgi:response regulator RpfG family c-di-GMP phosphodiesterase
MSKFQIIVYGADSSVVHPDVKDITSLIDYQKYDIDQMLEPSANVPNAILCYAPTEEAGITSLEIAQTLRNVYPETPLFFISLDKKTFDKKKLIKNGFTQAFLLPWEKADLIRAMNNEVLCTLLPELRDYKAIKVADLLPGVVLEFALKVYLPKSNKLIYFSHEGDPISDDKFKKLQESNLNTLFVKKDDVYKFKDYTANVFRKLLKPGNISETDKQEKLENCVRDLISDMFVEDTKENTFASSQTLLREVKDIIKLLIEDTHEEALEKINNIINQEENFYLHLSNVSTFAGLFSMILGVPNPQDVALAGLLHDIGKINLPQDIAELEWEEMTPPQREAFKLHPNFTLDIVKLRRIALPDSSIKAILQHHEAVNGTGYPKGLEGPKISKEARVLAIANTFDHLTTLHSNYASLSPREALTKMFDDNLQNMTLDMEMLKKLKQVLIT